MEIRKIKIFDKFRMKKRIEKFNSTVHMRYKNDDKIFVTMSKTVNPFIDGNEYKYIFHINILASYFDKTLLPKLNTKSSGGGKFALNILYNDKKMKLFSSFSYFDKYNTTTYNGKDYYTILILSDNIPKSIYIRNRYFLRNKAFKEFKSIQNKIRKITERGELNNEKESEDI